VKGFGIGGFIGLVELEIVHLDRDRVTGYWLTGATVMEGCVLLQGMAQLYTTQIDWL
jgi:hypothetical protein